MAVLQDIGFVHYWRPHDYAAAAEWFQKAADSRRRPEWLRPLAATTLAQGGDRAVVARCCGSRSCRVARDERLAARDARPRASLQLDALDQIDRLQAVVEADIRRRAERPPHVGGSRRAPATSAACHVDPARRAVLDSATVERRVDGRQTSRPLQPLPADRRRQSPMTTDAARIAAIVLAAAFGLAIGSFLNVCIYRLPRGESIVCPASRCPPAARAAWYDNIPVAQLRCARRPLPPCRARILADVPDRRAVTAARFAAALLVIGLNCPSCRACSSRLR